VLYWQKCRISSRHASASQPDRPLRGRRAPHIFADPLAAEILGEQAEELLHYHRDSGDHLILRGARTQVVIRSRYTEDRLAEAVRTAA
jgi:O-methyltransferase involved in polyketide biosynthesis